jgi:long-chain fatty acid transport protein
MPFRDLFARAARGSLLVLLAAVLPAPAQQGVLVDGVGPINQSMGGAAVAAPIDSAGALYWNPAGISGLQHTEMEFGLGLLLPQSRLASGVNTALLPFLPAIQVSGSDRSDPGFSALPSLGLVYQPEDSPFTYGLGVFAIGGFSVNYPADHSNPILSPPPLAGTGIGPLYTSYQVLQVVPTLSCQITQSLSFGFAPTADLAVLSADPGLFSPADASTSTGIPFYPPATHTRSAWGLGFQTGVYWTTDAGWNFGASLKSPQWFEPFRYNSVDSQGEPQTTKFHIDLPLIASLGASCTALPRTVIALDLRYIDYRNTNGFNSSGFGAGGAVSGLGWDSVFVAALGVQYKLTDALSLRAGYTYNTNPIPDQQAFFNIGAPLVLEHTVAVGASYQVSKSLLLSVAYAHSFANSITGPYVTPFGPLPGTYVQSTSSADFIQLGATLQF